jgi:hypothetical protein
MTLHFPVGFIAIFISLYLFYEYNRVRRAKYDERREDRIERQQELLDNIYRARKKGRA